MNTTGRMLCGAICGRARLWLGLSIFAVTLGAVASGLLPLALKRLVDAAGDDASQISSPLLAYVVALLAQRLAEQGQAYAHGRGEMAAIREFNALAYAHLLRLPLGAHLVRPAAALAQTMSEGVVALRLVLGHAVSTALPLAVQLAVGVVVLDAELGARLAFVLSGAVLVYGGVFALTTRDLAAKAGEISQAVVQASASLHEGLAAVETLKAFGAESHQVLRYDKALSMTEHRWRSFLLRRTLAGAAASLVFVAASASGLWLVAKDISLGVLAAGDLVLVSAFLLTILRPLETLGLAIRDIGQARAQLAALDRLLKSPAEPSGPKSKAPPRREGADLSFENVDFDAAPGRPALRGVSFRLEPGAALALVGPSGAGKTSVVRLALGFHPADRGVVRWDGEPIARIGLAALRSQIALVSQDIVLLNDTLAANIGLGRLEAGVDEISRAADAAGLSGLIDDLPEGLATRVGDRGHLLSGGERQRVAIARALLKQPRLLVLDEAASALDPAAESELRGKIEQLSATRLIVAHRLPPPAAQILVLERGRIVERGSHADLLGRRGLYWRLWRAQTSVYG